MQQSQYKSSMELKFLARMQTAQHFGLIIATIILKFIIVYFTSNLVSMLVPMDGVTGYVVNFILLFFVDTAASLLSVGASLIFLKTACGINSSIDDLFCGFRKSTMTILKIGAIISLVESICTIPLNIAAIQYVRVLNSIPYFNENNLNTLSPFLMRNAMDSDELLEAYAVMSSASMKVCLVMLVCTVVSLILTLPFFPAFYMILDFPGWNASTVLKRSFEVMHGNKMRLFLLYVSFIPSYLLSIFTCGLSLIWVIPYMNMTLTNFYLDLMSVRNKTV